MGLSDYFGFASMTLLLIGAANWGTVALRYAIKDLPGSDNITIPDAGLDGVELYKEVPTPDLLDFLGATPDVQMIVYWTVFASGIFYLGLFIYNSIEFKTVEE